VHQQTSNRWPSGVHVAQAHSEAYDTGRVRTEGGLVPVRRDEWQRQRARRAAEKGRRSWSLRRADDSIAVSEPATVCCVLADVQVAILTVDLVVGDRFELDAAEGDLLPPAN